MGVTKEVLTEIGAGDKPTMLVFNKVDLCDEVFLPRELRVVGIFMIGHQALDRNTVIVTLRRMQDLYGLGQAVQDEGGQVELAFVWRRAGAEEAVEAGVLVRAGEAPGEFGVDRRALAGAGLRGVPGADHADELDRALGHRRASS